MTQVILLSLGSYGLALLVGIVFYQLATRGLEAVIRWCRPDPDDLLRFILWHSPPSFRGTPESERLRGALTNREVAATMTAVFSMLGLSPILRQWWHTQAHAWPLPWSAINAVLVLFAVSFNLLFAYGSAVSRIARGLLLERFPNAPAARGEPPADPDEPATP